MAADEPNSGPIPGSSHGDGIAPAPATFSSADANAPGFAEALARLPEGSSEGRFEGARWGVTVRRSTDGKRVWLYGEARDGSDIVSFNLYHLQAAGAALKPCEMSSQKVVDFVLGFVPDGEHQQMG
ncbi:hypothetical protein ACLE20_13730 [Rhizobium sp. YIM 134829]|uniref:hypothetical protein n=1 Tax=Rhizobium sp. YIM 134829 TaxID=3390453 RepID=UPI00397CBF5C